MAAQSTGGQHEPFTEPAALKALVNACREVGLDGGSAELIRIGSNAVFRLDPDTIARVAPSSALIENAQKQIDVARWLETIDYSATRAIDVSQPVQAEGRVVTFWRSVAPEAVYAPIKDVAALIRQLHQLTPPPSLSLPGLCPFGATSDELPEFRGLSDADAQYLRSRIEWARSEFPSLPFVLPQGVIHGDANVGNVLVDDAGQAVLIDLDGFATGPREWDLIQTALFYDRLGWHSREEYETFVEVYGFDLLEWPGYADLADMREIAMTSWLGRKAGDSASTAKEAAKRIEAIRTGGSRRDWGAY
jgi:aminoglycoside phosphotransferase (APT) family kinase protein